MADDLQGRTFLVTGANSGIGRAMVEALAARGGHVVLAARSEERTRPVLDGIRALRPSAAVEFLQLDVSDLASVRRAAAAYLATGRPLDVLVNNAGVAGTRRSAPTGSTSPTRPTTSARSCSPACCSRRSSGRRRAGS